MRILKGVAIAVVVILVLAIVGIGGYLVFGKVATDQRQKALEPFYTVPSPLPAGQPGELMRTEDLTGTFTLPTGAKAYRVLYRTENPDGSPRVSGGMVFVPAGQAPAGGRKVISWAHPTVGMGDACAPSRSKTPTGLLDWLPGMLERGWVVTATDYAGLGTPGPEFYLVGQAETNDVVNAVRAARQVPGADAGTQYGVFGHSQGGHAAMWAGALAPAYAPELQLVGVAGAAPAAPLSNLVGQLWDQPVAWVIGAEVFVSYPDAYPGLDPSAVGTKAAMGGYQKLAQQCLIDGILNGEVRDFAGQKFFSSDPMTNPAWAAAITAQSTPPLPATMPALVTESVNDGVVVPQSIAAMQQQWCAAGSTLQVDWLGPLRGTPEKVDVMSHMYEGAIGGALATTWFEDRFAGIPATTSCSQTPPLALTTP